jgi:hypothetical protein
MKKIDLVHTTILIVAILSGYEVITYAISMLSMLAYTFEPGMFNPASQQMGLTLIVLICFAAVTILLVKYGRRLAELMLKNDPESLAGDAAKWDLDRRNILLVLFIGLGLYTLINTVPYTLKHLYDAFTTKVYLMSGKSNDTDQLIIELLRVLLAFFLIYAAPTLTNFIEKTIAVRFDNKDSKP